MLVHCHWEVIWCQSIKLLTPLSNENFSDVTPYGILVDRDNFMITWLTWSGDENWKWGCQLATQRKESDGSGTHDLLTFSSRHNALHTSHFIASL